MNARQHMQDRELARLLELIRHSAREDAPASDRQTAAARQRATALLRACLTDAEWNQLTGQGYLEVASPSQRRHQYRIPRGGGRLT